MKKILVPCDFSAPAINAFRQAVSIAEQSGGEVHLLNVIEPPLEDGQIGNAENQLKNLIKKSKRDSVKSDFVVRVGSLPDVIEKYTADHHIDLVVMGSSGAGGVKEYLIGSNAEKVVRQSPVPVLIIKNYYEQPIRKIVFPNTLEHQDDLVMKVKELQHFFDAKLCLVYINTQFGLADESTTLLHLQQFADRFMLKNYSLNVHNHTSIEKGIIEFTKLANGDMIALGTHGHKGLVHLVKGSIAEDIVNHTDCPIWTYRMKDD